MNRKLLFSLFLLLTVAFSVSAIQATDINATDSSLLDLNEENIQTETLNYDNSSIDDVDSNLSESTKNQTELVSSTNSTYYKGDYSVMLKNSNNSAPLADKKVKFVINNKNYTAKTDKKGVASITLKLKPGKYDAFVYFPGDSEFYPSNNLTAKFKVLSTIASSNIKNVEGDSRKFVAYFFKSNGKPLAKKYIKFKVDSKKYKVKTNSKGKAIFSLKKLKKGTYKITCYNKDGLSKTYKIKIYKRKASTKLTSHLYTFLPNDNRKVDVELATGLNDDSNVGKIIKIKINGKTYSRKTDGDGIAHLDLNSFNKGYYKVDYTYEGNKFFKKAKSTNYVTILDSLDTTLTVKSTTHFGYGAGTLFKVAFKAGGVPLAKRTMTFNLDGKTYVETTDNKGIASIPIDLNIGNYTVSYQTNARYGVNGTSDTCGIDVFKRSDCKLTWKCGTTFKDSSQTFKVKLTNLKGKTITYGTVEMTIDGETYDATIKSDGYAKIKTSVALGKYNVKVKFLGNNEYLPTTTSKSITVKLSKFGNGINEKNAVSHISAYLKSSSHCQVGNAKIKELVKSLTSGLTDNVDKAKAIFNYVRDNLEYGFYYNTLHGAVGTLTHKKGNCVDHSHLLVAMFRTAGFKARYIHGRCTFSDGPCGHVWTQVLVDKTWICADATSYRNCLGKVANWNTNSFKLHAKYASLPF